MADIQSLLELFRKKREELHKLEAEIKASESKQFTALPKQVGLRSIDELIKALVPHASPRMKAFFGAKAQTATVAASKTPKAAAGSAKRKRAKITDEIRAKVVEAVKAGGKTAEQIAGQFGISAPSVANIKKAAGLTRKKGKKK